MNDNVGKGHDMSGGRGGNSGRGRGRWRPENKAKGPGPVPKKWLAYTKLGERMAGSQFIIFKTPLKDDINRTNAVPEDKRFTPSDLLKMIADKGQELGLVIDMTNTKRYYQAREFTDRGVEYEKIQLTGFGELPSEDDVQGFRMIVDRFLTRNYNKLIGVHGTTSTNRPGYLICRYMMEKRNVEASQAIKDFNKARGHPIDEQCYIDALMSYEPVHKLTKPTGTDNDDDDDDDEGLFNGLEKVSLSHDLDECKERRPRGFSADDYSY